MQYDTVSQSQSSATRAKKRNVFTPEGDEALKQILESGEIARVGYKKGWILCAKIMRQKYGIYCTDRNCRERFKYSLDPSLKQDQNQWNDEEVQYIINLVEKYGPDISVIAEAMEGRTGVSVRNCVTNQLRKAIRYLEQLLQTQLKVEVDKIQSKDLIKLGGILVAQAPNTVDRTQNLRQRLIAMWKMIDKTQKPSHTDLIQSYRQLMGVRKEFLPQRPKKTEPQKIVDPAKQRRRLVKMQKKERTRKKKQQKQGETSLKQQEVHKLKIRKEAQQKRQREQSLLKLQKTMEKKVKQNNQIATPNIFEQQ